MGETTTVTEKGQTTIPQEVRERYGIEPGDEVEWVDTDEGVVVRKSVREGGRGMLVPEDTPAETREAIARELTERLHDRRTQETPDR